MRVSTIPHIQQSCRLSPKTPTRKHKRNRIWRQNESIRLRCSVNSSSSKEKERQQEKILQEVMERRVEEAGKLLDDMIDDIVVEISTVQSMGYIYNEMPAETESQIISKVVKRFLKRLDQNFLACLERFEQRSRDMGSVDVAKLIDKIRSEVLLQTNEQFPPEVLLLEDLMKISDKEERVAKMREVAEVSESEPPVSKESPESENPEDALTDGDLAIDIDESIPIEEMDLEAELKRLKILKSDVDLKRVKEEIERDMKKPPVVEPVSEFEDVMSVVNDPLEDFEPDQSEEERRAYGKRIDPLQLGLAANQFITDIEEKEEIANRQLLAKLCVIREEARLLEMEMRFAGVQMEDNPIKLRENVPAQAMGVIQNLIKTPDAIKRVGLIRKIFEKDDYRPGTRDLSRAPGYVRPGMFMTAITMAQMDADEKSKHASSASEISPELLHRFDDVRLEAMLVLREMGWGEFSTDELTQRQKDRAERQKKVQEEYFSNDNVSEV